MNQMEKGKGRILKGYVEFVKKKWGADGLAEAEKFVGISLANIQDEKWYPNQSLNDILKWMADTKGMDYARQAGYYAITNKAIISFAAKIAGINRVLDRGIKEFQDAFNYGSIDIERNEMGAVIRVKDTNYQPPACAAWQGALEGILKITGTRGDVKETACQLKGEDACAFEMVWKLGA